MLLLDHGMVTMMLKMFLKLHATRDYAQPKEGESEKKSERNFLSAPQNARKKERRKNDTKIVNGKATKQE